MAELKTPKISAAQAKTLSASTDALYANHSSQVAREVQMAINGMSQKHFSDFDSIRKKYPGISKDLAMSMVGQGLNADTPGLGKIVSLDGISQLKQDLMNVDKIKKDPGLNSNGGILQSIDNAYRKTIYDPFKGLVRVTFAALRLPYDYATTNVRNAYSVHKDEVGATERFTKGLLNPGASTHLGSLVKDIFDGTPGVSTGSGFFINPESRVGKYQSKAMGAYGRVNGESFTIGRGLADSIGASPGTNGYKVLSGLVDASLNIAMDPSTWIPAGAVGKILKGGQLQRVPGKILPRKVSIGEAKATGFPLTEQADQASRLSHNDKNTREHIVAAKQSAALSGNIRAGAEGQYLKATRELGELENARTFALTDSTQTALNTTIDTTDNLAKNPEAAALLSKEQIAKWVITHPGAQDGSLTNGLNQLSADVKNTGGFFGGHLFFDELPEINKISAAVNDLDEYAVTFVGKKEPKLLDLNEQFPTARGKQEESMKRNMLHKSVDDEANNLDNPPAVRQVFQDLSTKFYEDTKELGGPAGNVLFSSGKETMATLFQEAALSRNAAANKIFLNMVKDIYQVDGFKNVRSIFGGEGGIVITNSKLLAASKASISEAVAGTINPETIGLSSAKILDSIKGPESELAQARLNLENATAERSRVLNQLEDIGKFKRYAEQNPDELQRIAHDPSNKELQNLIGLNTKMADTDTARLAEYYRHEVGLTNSFNGELTDTFHKGLKYMLGRRFAEIARVVADETSSARIRTFFGKKLDDDMVNELTNATTTDAVYRVFLKHLGQEQTDPNIFRSATLRGEVNNLKATPMATLVSKINPLTMKYVEAIDRSFNRTFVRQATVSLSDKTALINTMENWLTSTRIFSILDGGFSVRRVKTNELVDNVVAKLIASTGNKERATIIENTMTEIAKLIAAKLGIRDADEIQKIVDTIKIGSRDRKATTAYSVDDLVNNAEPIVHANGETINFDGAVHAFQAMQDVVNFPDSKAIVAAMDNFSKNKLTIGARATKVFAEELGDIWRTAQLVFRVSYVIRNVAEMQVRQLLSGHDSIIGHPFRFLSMMMADVNGGATQKQLARYATHQYDLGGNAFKTLDAEVDANEAILGYQQITNRTGSVSDYRSDRMSAIYKNYEVVNTNAKSYFKGLAYTLSRFSGDSFNPSIARLMNGGSEAQKRAYIKELVDRFDEPNSVLKEFVSSIFEKNVGLQRTFFKDLDLGPVKSNIDEEKMFTHFFDESQPHTLAHQINTVAGTGPMRHIVLDIIQNGRASWVNKNGETVRLVAPRFDYNSGAGSYSMAEKAFEKKLEKIGAENLTGSRVLVAKDIGIKATPLKKYEEFTQRFFEFASRQESKWNFGPEYQMAYWDYAGRYRSMLSTKDLKYAVQKAQESLNPITFNGKKLVGRPHKVLTLLQKELKKRENPNYVHYGNSKWQTIHQMAAREASSYTSKLFYDAASQGQYANAWRLAFPFAQAQANTMRKWGQLMVANPVPAYRFTKAFDALTKPGSNTIYQVTGMSYEDDKGFFYKEEGRDNLQFKMPLVGSILGAMAGRNINMKDALQITAPVQSLNLAFGQVSPLVPGFGPAVQGAFAASPFNDRFGPGYDILRDIITPFGAPSGADFIFPAWLRKSAAYALDDSGTVQRGVKGWATYLAGTGRYGEDVFSNDAERTRLFNDAATFSRNLGILNGLFSSISPATPIQEVLSSIKDTKNKGNFITMTMLYKNWSDIEKANPGNYDKAVYDFSEQYGANNLLLLLGSTTSASRGSEDAWTFLNANPTAADKYAGTPGDVIPYFFPGGEFSSSYYRWQKDTGSRALLSNDKLNQKSQMLLYRMRLSKIAEEQIELLKPKAWYVAQVAKLDQEFGGSRPTESIETGTADEKVNRIKLALEDPAFQKSPVYQEVAEFYPKYQEFREILNKLKVSNYAAITSRNAAATMIRNSLVKQAEELMMRNPSFSRMYYGVFAGLLED